MAMKERATAMSTQPVTILEWAFSVMKSHFKYHVLNVQILRLIPLLCHRRQVLSTYYYIHNFLISYELIAVMTSVRRRQK